ncbi:MAG TPA: hypothetical protein PLC98_23450 [Anaerolineales bacterium]|nr:hypothetical protein [Anaerolineales bacterium]
MTIQFNTELLERYLAPGISTFVAADIPDLSAIGTKYEHWLSNHFLNSTWSGAYKAPMRQYAINAIYRIQTAVDSYLSARELTLHYLSVTRSDNPAIKSYFRALARWETCFLNWEILVEVFRRLSGTQAFKRNDGSPDQRAYSIANEIKHCGDSIHRGDHVGDLTVPVWLANDGFHSRVASVSYSEFGSLMADAALFADDLEIPRKFFQPPSGDEDS